MQATIEKAVKSLNGKTIDYVIVQASNQWKFVFTDGTEALIESETEVEIWVLD